MGLLYAAHMRGLKIWLAYGERVYGNIIITLRVVKSTPAALVKSPRNARWCMHYHAKHAIIEPTHVGGIK